MDAIPSIAGPLIAVGQGTGKKDIKKIAYLSGRAPKSAFLQVPATD
jgi:hypothetical protein